MRIEGRENWGEPSARRAPFSTLSLSFTTVDFSLSLSLSLSFSLSLSLQRCGLCSFVAGNPENLGKIPASLTRARRWETSGASADLPSLSLALFLPLRRRNYSPVLTALRFRLIRHSDSITLGSIASSAFLQALSCVWSVCVCMYVRERLRETANVHGFTGRDASSFQKWVSSDETRTFEKFFDLVTMLPVLRYRKYNFVKGRGGE